jgi:hypothetical protein
MRSAFFRIAIPTLVLVACSGGQENTGSTSSALTGPVEMRVVNVVDGDEAAETDVSQIVVTIQRVDARIEAAGEDDEAGWTTLSVKRTTVDLLSLQGATFAALGVTTLPAGGVERLRLFVDDAGPNYVVTRDGVTHPLVIPSDDDRGILMVGDFDVAPCATGQVTLAFAGRKSIAVHPVADGSEWVLRPVIRLHEVVASGVCPNEDQGDDKGHEHGHDKGQ